MSYIFTNEEVERAHNTDLASFLEGRHEVLERVGSNTFWSHNGERIAITGNLWYNFYTQKGGEAITFVKEFFNVGFGDAVGILLGESVASMEERSPPPKPNKDFVLPERNPRMNRVFAYLTTTRSIPNDIVKAFVDKKLIYEEKKYHNVVFLGCDKNGTPKHAHMRGSGASSKFKMTTPGSNPDYSFHWNGSSNELFVFEAPIDMLSYIAMYPADWKNNTYSAACSVADKVILQCLKDNPDIDTVHLCFDNDVAGQSASTRVKSKLEDMGYKVDVLVPEHKDWNEDLVNKDSNSIKME